MSLHASDKKSVRPSSLIKVGQHLHLRGTSIMTFLIYWLMVLTYPNFFIINPSAESGTLRQVSLWLCLIGWVIQSLITPVLLWKLSDGFTYPMRWLPLTTLMWPAGILLAQITAYMQTQTSFLGYLIDYPIFVITDIALPALILWKWHELKVWISIQNGNLS